MQKIRDLLDVDSDFLITGITDDSRLVKPGFLFVATKGFYVDHFDYIEDAVARGASFVVCDRKPKVDIPYLLVSDVFLTYIELCQKFYEVDPNSLSKIGITGTDGKTTTATILHEILDDCAYLGTNGLDVGEYHFSTNQTTPCISELYQDFRLIQKNHCGKVAMEVSSEALLHDRVHSFFYDVVCFTNITGDHLNVHKTFGEYVACKMKLLEHVSSSGVVVYNGDDEVLKTISFPRKISFGFSSDNDYVITSVSYQKRKTKIQLEGEGKEFIIHSPLIGKYNVYNVVMAFLVGRLYQIEDCLLLKRIQELKPIKGRCEFLDFGQKYDIVLDYAHTIHGIRSILETFQDASTLIVVTGCAGGRDLEKRPIIGDLVIQNSDFAIFTMDDPREEDVGDIIDQMAQGSKDYFRIPDREEAITYALSIADPGSVVLILGKGRDSYMAIHDKKIHYSDYEVIRHYFSKE